MSHSAEKIPSNDEAIEAMAAAWLVQEEEGFTSEQSTEFARWQSADPRHQAAVAMLRETCGILGKLPQLETHPDLRHELQDLKRAELREAESSKVVRFPWSTVVKVAVGIAACVTLMLVVGRFRSERVEFSNSYATTAGGYLRVSLPDESVLELNANTEVRVQFTERERRLSLGQGEAHFTVAKNPTRPFTVGAGNVAVRATGTAFNIRMERALVEVLVTEGRVKVGTTKDSVALSTTGFATSELPELSAGQRIRVSNLAVGSSASPEVTALESSAVRAALAWQMPRLVFVETPLSEVVEQFNQRNRVQLEIGDTELGRRPVGGTFRGDQVETFVQLLEKSGDITIDQPDDKRIVLRKAQVETVR